MIDQKKKIFNLVLLIFFFLTISFTNFFHTEKTLFEDNQCPACNLQKASQATGQIYFFHFPPPAFYETLQTDKSVNYSYVVLFYFSSRAPPQL